MVCDIFTEEPDLTYIKIRVRQMIRKKKKENNKCKTPQGKSFVTKLCSMLEIRGVLVGLERIMEFLEFKKTSLPSGYGFGNAVDISLKNNKQQLKRLGIKCHRTILRNKK